MIRVAFTSLAPFISGAERSLQVTLRHLSAAGADPIVIGPSDSKIAPWCERNSIPFLSCSLPFRDKWHPVRWWRSVRRLRGLLRDNRIDIVHANQMWSYPAIGTAARDLGLIRACHLRDEVESAALHWCCPTGPEAAICISSHIARQAESAWAADTVRPRIESRINPVEFVPALDPTEDQSQRELARRILGIPTEDIVFGFIGQIREVKGVLGLLDAVATLRSSRRWRLVIAGRDNDPGAFYERRCRERAARPDLSDRVQFLGYLDETTNFYRAIDLAVVPSLEEPMGRIPLEAAAAGRPTLAFSTGGLPDVVRDGKTGWLVPTSDWTALTRVLERVLENPPSEMGQSARAWVETVADPLEYSRWLVGIYHQLIELGGAALSFPSRGHANIVGI